MGGLETPDLGRWRAGNTGTEGVWHLRGTAPGPRVALSAVMHGNEIVGAIVIASLLAHGLRPRRGTLTFAFCNLAAFDCFDPATPRAARFIEEDMNRQWSDERLSERRSLEARRAADLAPWLTRVDRLLDLHSMHLHGEAVLLAGAQAHNLQLAAAIGAPSVVVTDPGHATGARLIDHAAFDEPSRQAVLLEAGGHLDAVSLRVTQRVVSRYLVCTGVVEPGDLPAWRAFGTGPEVQRVVQVHQRAEARSKRARLEPGVAHLQTVPYAGTVIGHDGDDGTTSIATPFDECVLLMPHTFDLQPGHTIVRFGRWR